MGTLYSGLVSITFRTLSVPQIVDLVSKAGQKSIEWGGDIHVPHGDVRAARRARQACSDAGIATPSYGSYFRLGVSESSGVSFTSVLDTAAELSAKTVRVWAGNKGSAETTEDERSALVEEARSCAELAAASGMTVSLEYHGGTLTDTGESARAFFASVGHEALRSYWQPRAGAPKTSSLAELDGVAPYLSNIHVFHWHDFGDRMTLAEGKAAWRAYLSRAAEVSGERYAMLEFVRDDDPQQYLADASTLSEILLGLQ